MTKRQFIDHVRSELRDRGYKVDLADRKYLVLPEESYSRCYGYFDCEGKLLKCAINRPINKWFPVLVHEYSHFQQWQQNTRSWRGVFIKGYDRTDEIFRWVQGKKLPFKKIVKWTIRARNLELECERMAIKNIKRLDLPLDIEAYAKRASAYVHWWNYILVRRKWYNTGRVPYEVPEVYSKMPKTLRGTYDDIPDRYVELYDKYC